MIILSTSKENSTVFQYLAYGLGIHSQLRLFELPVSDVKQDVTIRVGTVDPAPGEDGAPYPYLMLTQREAIFAIEGIGRFKVSEGSHIVVDPQPGGDSGLLQRYLIGAAMALVLYQRQRLVLHASAVSVGGQGIVFLGASGAGKSTIAAACLARGHLLLADDVTAVDVNPGISWLDPGFPHIKLSNDATGLLASNPAQIEFMIMAEDKASFHVNQPISRQAIALKRIYILLPDDPVGFDRLSSKQALVELVRYSIPPSMVRLDSANHFQRCVNLVNNIQVYLLHRPAALTSLPELIEMIEADCVRKI